ncbi:MAG: DUF3883 domain-containing protein [Thaumarchaeota archaeon]|nr:DUF3883 domain-containing protein [Nitrososphaerota archaeon]
MTVDIPEELFLKGHKIFLGKIKKETGKDFNDFEHNDYLLVHEIRFKQRAWSSARDELKLDKWQNWQKTPGKIINAVNTACNTKDARGLLYNKIPKARSARALDQPKTIEEKRGLEKQLFNLFFGDERSARPDDVGLRFNALVSYFTANKLKKDWRFFAFLLFLLDSNRYFPFLPTQFRKLLEFYHIDEKLKDKSWATYSILLALVDELKDKLANYGTLDAIAVQSYMWVISGEIVKKKLKPENVIVEKPKADFAKEVKKRNNGDSNKNVIGVRGEEFVIKEEEKKLREHGLEKLIEEMDYVASTGTETGYDIKSFDLDGMEIHIEVKTTENSKSDQDVFYLTKREREKAMEDDKNWHLYRVYEINNEKRIEDLGNIVVNSEKYDFEPYQYKITLKK